MIRQFHGKYKKLVKNITHTFRFTERSRKDGHFKSLYIGKNYGVLMRKVYFTLSIRRDILNIKNKGLTKTLYLYYNFKNYERQEKDFSISIDRMYVYTPYPTYRKDRYKHNVISLCGIVREITYRHLQGGRSYGINSNTGKTGRYVRCRVESSREV